MAPPRPLPELVRYCHPDKILAATRLPGTLTEAAIARLYGTDVATYRTLRADLVAEARAAAATLLADRSRSHGAARGLGGSPFATGSTILALGDSITDDRGSWAEILRHARPDLEIFSAGLSGDTTTAAIARLSRLTVRTTWALVLLGTNDARRHGDAPMLVSHAETRRNLRVLDAALRRRCRRVRWITPPPIFAPVEADPDLHWDPSDVAAKAQLVRALDPAAIDLWPGFAPDHLGADGLHPSPAGQRFIAGNVLCTT
jgi:lysophospholipase L1-like esterase